MGVDGKKKGGAYERKVAKMLSLWMFNDPHTLKRSADSGAQKVVWTGDIVPVKQLPDEWSKKWPFEIECKTGYDEHKPDFWSFHMLQKWFIKSTKEGKLHNQYITLLITQFLNRTALITTNVYIQNIPFLVCFQTKVESDTIFCYVYRFKDILELPFSDVFKLEEIIKDE